MRILLMCLIVKNEVRGIGRMGLRGRIGHGFVKEMKLRLLVWLVVPIARHMRAGEKKRAVDVQSMGPESRPWLGETRADPPAGYPSQSGRGPADRAGLPEARRSPAASNLRRDSDRAYRLFSAR
jgi:hypothetical protein